MKHVLSFKNLLFPLSKVSLFKCQQQEGRVKNYWVNMGFGWIMDPNMSTKGANSSITITSPQHDNVKNWETTHYMKKVDNDSFSGEV